VAEQRVTRRLTTILAADVAGYSRLTGADEEGTVSRLRALRQELIDPVIAANGGRTVKLMGDGRLVEFASVVGAVRCAIEVQSKIAVRNIDVAPDKRIEFRVGIHLGDVMVENDGDLMGDGVNIAARLEGIADPGGICLTNAAYEQVRGKIAEEFIDLGDKELKNITRPMRVYRIDLKAPSTQAIAEAPKPTLALPDKPSIAVLPFQNMSGDPEQDYFCDGMVEDIITGLSRIRWLFVIARNSSFVYKGKAVDVKQVGRDLGVRYVLEGGVRKATNRVRITGQLIDATSGTHIWADRFDGGLEDIFDLQDRITESVVGAIEPALRTAEMQRAQIKPTQSLDAYDYFLRALAEWYSGKPSYEGALAFCRKSIATDPRYASAFGLASICVAVRIANGQALDVESERTEGIASALKAIELGPDDPTALWMAGWALVLAGRDYDRGLAAIDRSLSLNSNAAQAWNASGWCRWNIGDGNTAIDHFQRAMRLNPLDPLSSAAKAGVGWAHFVEGRYEDAVKWADMAWTHGPRSITALRCKVAALGLLGRTEEAREAVRVLLTVQPDATIPNLRRLMPLKRAEHMAIYLEGLSKAGIPKG
jgi:TolB-like protein/class 3 adenylate cyclase/Tfp pilus assembly protein PilF